MTNGCPSNLILGCDAIKELCQLDFQKRAHLGLGDTTYCPNKELKSMSEAFIR